MFWRDQCPPRNLQGRARRREGGREKVKVLTPENLRNLLFCLRRVRNSGDLTALETTHSLTHSSLLSPLHCAIYHVP